MKNKIVLTLFFLIVVSFVFTIDFLPVTKAAETDDKAGSAWAIAPVVGGKDDLCESLTLSAVTLGQGESITVTSKSKNSDTVSFGWWLYNMDNLDAKKKPMPIKFVTGTKVAGVVKNKTVADDTNTLIIDFEDINRRDISWKNYQPKPKNIRVDAYFKKTGSTKWSKFDASCSKTFKALTVDPTPTPNAKCVCGATGSCAAVCFFDKHASGAAYTSPMKCNLPASLFKTAPTSANKTAWCRTYLRTKGDANGDGLANVLDYYYYVAGTFGAKLNPNINIDFNGDNVISNADRQILIKSLKD